MLKAIEVNINIMANANGNILVVKDKIRNTRFRSYLQVWAGMLSSVSGVWDWASLDQVGHTSPTHLAGPAAGAGAASQYLQGIQQPDKQNNREI